MRRHTLAALAIGFFGLGEPLKAAELPVIDYQAQCAKDTSDKYRAAICLAIEENALKDLTVKWSKIPIELKDGCAKETTYDRIAGCLRLGFIKLKAKRGLCPGGTCKADSELDLAMPEARFYDPDITPFPKWDSAALCEALVKKLDLMDDVDTCVTEERLSKVHVALLWPKLSGEARFYCVDRVSGLESYNFLEACFAGVLTSK